uniref:Uncharacterized protein n=1 Tax=Cacopsylla melanoneura TaxID=428564 RepID=A0A8D8Q9B3_9HEMI
MMPTSKIRPPIKTSKRQTPSRKSYQKKRHERFRDTKNKEFTARQDSVIKSFLQPLLDLDKLQALGFTSTPITRTVPVPVSTRAIGFGLYQTLRGSFGVNGSITITRPAMLSMYRHLHNKLASKWALGVGPTIDHHLYQIPFISEQIRPVLSLDAWVPLLASRYLEGLGPITLQNGNRYAPVLALNPIVQGHFWPRPDNVCINNLRETVVALANADIPQSVREAFFQHNPIPGAIWNEQFILQNPDEIMPAEYGIVQATADSGISVQILSEIQKKAPKFVSQTRQVTTGSMTLLVTTEFNSPYAIPSCDVANILNVPQPIGNWLIKHALPPADGNCYYSDQLTPSETVESWLTLYGEWLPPPMLRLEINSRRDPGLHHFQIAGQRGDVLTALFGQCI